MASTRQSLQPLQIYQDPINFDHAPMPSTRAQPTSASMDPLRPLKSASLRRNTALEPPKSKSTKLSPFKESRVHNSITSPSRAPFSSKLANVSMPPPLGEMACSTDSIPKKQPSMSNFKTGAQPPKAYFSTFPRPSGEKENFPWPAYPTYPSNPSEYEEVKKTMAIEAIYGQKLPLKRTLLEAAHIEDVTQSKRSKLDEAVAVPEDDLQELPPPDSLATPVDDGTKPPHSYAQLIGMAILRAQSRRLTLAHIYRWISDTFSFYSPTDAGWQNSIRHNLSLNKAFIKQERPKDDPGKGNYWAIEPGMEFQFMKDKTTRRLTNSNDSAPILSASFGPLARPGSSHAGANTTTTAKTPTLANMAIPASQSLRPASQPLPKSTSVRRPLGPIDLSSDATIPASDSFERPLSPSQRHRQRLLSPLPPSSPPVGTIHSSPPVARSLLQRHNTPPPVPRFPGSSIDRTRKRKVSSMNDSGFFSSLDSSINSSALRRQTDRLLTSEADRPLRGRAEEEIARLRASPYDSPTRSNALTGFAPPSSSPLRRGSTNNDAANMLPPLTPAVKMHPPVKPPPSTSPNTYLRIHRDRVRELVGSPVQGVLNVEEHMWSPAFYLDDHPHLFQDDEFDSPEKRSVKRPRLGANSTTGMVTIGDADLWATPTFGPFKATPQWSPSLFNESPTKRQSTNFGAIEVPQPDFYGAEFLAEEATDFDIMQGFQKIGASNLTSNQASKPPGHGRSFTSRF